MLTVAECQKKLLSMTAGDFNAEYLFNNKNWYFEESPNGGQFGDYDDFRRLVAKSFKLTAHEVVMVGSAKMGYSLSPTKNFAQFHKESDIDVAVISSSHFETTWAAIIAAHYAGIPIKKEETIDGTLAGDIFRRFITLRQDYEFVSNHLRDTQILLDEIQKLVAAPLDIRNTLTFRLYRDFDSLRDYHLWSTARLADKLMKGA